MTDLEGRRLPDTTWPQVLHDVPNPISGDYYRDGDYWKCTGYPGDPPRPASQPPDECWYLWWHGHPAWIPLHEIEEHEDGTITIEPRPGNSNSVKIEHGRNGASWHGYIYRGVWREV